MPGVAVRGPHSFNTLPSLPATDAAGQHIDYREPYPRLPQQSYPIRIPYPNGQTALPSPAADAHVPEYNLRRKTPCGTVEAGYDGSPTQPSPGPPPLKHMIVPGHAFHGSFAGPDHHGSRPQPPWAPPNSQRPSDKPPNDTPTQVNYQLSQWITGNPTGIGNTTEQRNVPRSGMLGPYGTLDQHQKPVIRANETNVRAFCPPPVSGPLMFDPAGFQPSRAAWETRGMDLDGLPYHLASPTDYEVKPRNYITQGHFVSPNFHSASAFRTPRDMQSHHPVPRAGHAASIRNTVTPAMPIEVHSDRQFHFRDKALKQAHQSYIELLSHLHANGRSTPTRTNPAVRTAHRLPSYPKPPRLRSANLPAPAGPLNLRAYPFTGLSSMNDKSQRRHTSDWHGSHSATAQSPCLKTAHAGNQAGFYNYTGVHGQHSAPTAKAVTSLDILQSLCEQSEWKWIDGLLVGGCLHYALERYSESYKWFSRIVTLDPW